MDEMFFKVCFISFSWQIYNFFFRMKREGHFFYKYLLNYGSYAEEILFFTGKFRSLDSKLMTGVKCENTLTLG